MIEHDKTLQCEDGTRIVASVFHSAGCDHWIIINSAMGVRRQFYRALANFLAAAGFNVVTYDYRGIAESAPAKIRDSKARLYEWGEQDFNAVLGFVCNEQPQSLSVIGHSVGTQIIGLAELNARIDAVVAVASQSGYWKHWHGLPRLGIWLLWHMVLPPIATVLGYFPGALAGGSVSLPGTIARDWARYGRDPDYIRGAHARESDQYYSQLKAPILALSISDDRYAPRAATEALLSWYDNAGHEIVEVTPQSLGVTRIKHFGWFRPDIGTRSWQLVVDWLANVVPGEASH